MNKDIKAKLEAEASKQKKHQDDLDATEAANKNTQAKNLADYNEKKEKLIKPALQEIVDLYKTKGIGIRIDEQDEFRKAKGGIERPYIGLDMHGAYPGIRIGSGLKPEFRLSFEKSTRTLRLYTSTGHSGGPEGDFPFDDLTADLIHEAFLKYQTGKR